MSPTRRARDFARPRRSPPEASSPPALSSSSPPLRRPSVPWATTNGTTYAWVFDGVSPGPRQFGLRIEGTSRLLDGDRLVARLNLEYERADGPVFAAGSAAAYFTSAVSCAPWGLEFLLLWIAVLTALFLLFLLLGYMDVLAHRRSSIDDVFLLHN